MNNQDYEPEELIDALKEILKDLYNGTFVDPSRLPRESVDELVRACHEGTDKAITLLDRLRRALRVAQPGADE
jgi:hypothetical protein